MLKQGQFELVDLGQTAIDQRNWLLFEEVYVMLKSSYYAENEYGDPNVANELADSTRTLTRQYRQFVEAIDPSNWVKTDGGRADAGFIGEAGDCVTRAISLALDLPYEEVWEYLEMLQGYSPDEGVDREASAEFLRDYGWTCLDPAEFMQLYHPSLSTDHGVKVNDLARVIDNGIVACHLLGEGHLVTIKGSKYLDAWNSGGLQSTELWIGPGYRPNRNFV